VAFLGDWNRYPPRKLQRMSRIVHEPALEMK
jgi:hypothetical protein